MFDISLMARIASPLSTQKKKKIMRYLIKMYCYEWWVGNLYYESLYSVSALVAGVLDV